MLLHVLGHVDAHHVLLRVEEASASVGPARSCPRPWAEEEERADGPARVLDARAGADHGVRDELDGLVLPDDALVQHLVQACSSFSRSPSTRRETGMPVQLGDDLGDLVLGDLLAEQAGVGFRWSLLGPLLSLASDAAPFRLGGLSSGSFSSSGSLPCLSSAARFRSYSRSASRSRGGVSSIARAAPGRLPMGLLASQRARISSAFSR